MPRRHKIIYLVEDLLSIWLSSSSSVFCLRRSHFAVLYYFSSVLHHEALISFLLYVYLSFVNEPTRCANMLVKKIKDCLRCGKIFCVSTFCVLIFCLTSTIIDFDISYPKCFYILYHGKNNTIA